MGVASWVVQGCAQRGPVEDATPLKAAAGDASSAMIDAGILGHGRPADPGTDLAASKPPPFGHRCDERSAGDGADAAGRAQQVIAGCEVFLHLSWHLRGDRLELGAESLRSRPRCWAVLWRW